MDRRQKQMDLSHNDTQNPNVSVPLLHLTNESLLNASDQLTFSEKCDDSNSTEVGALLHVVVTGLAFAAILLNLLILRAVSLYPRYFLTITNCFVINLALSNFCDGVLNLFETMFQHTDLLTTRNHCVAFQSIKVVFDVVNDLSVSCIALERFLAMCCPFEYHRYVSMGKLVVIVLGTWLASVMLSLPGVNVIGREGATGRLCHCWVYCLAFSQPDRMFVCALMSFPPALIMLICNLCVYRVASTAHMADVKLQATISRHSSVHSSAQLPKNSVQEQSDPTMPQNRAIILLYLPFVHAFCTLPHNCIMLYLTVDYEGAKPAAVKAHNCLICHITLMARGLEYTLNPFLYAFHNTEIVLAIRKIVFSLCLTGSGRSRRHSVAQSLKVQDKRDIAGKPQFEDLRFPSSQTSVSTWHETDVIEETSFAETSKYQRATAWLSRSLPVQSDGANRMLDVLRLAPYPHKRSYSQHTPTVLTSISASNVGMSQSQHSLQRRTLVPLDLVHFSSPVDSADVLPPNSSTSRRAITSLALTALRSHANLGRMRGEQRHLWTRPGKSDVPNEKGTQQQSDVDPRPDNTLTKNLSPIDTPGESTVDSSTALGSNSKHKTPDSPTLQLRRKIRK